MCLELPLSEARKCETHVQLLDRTLEKLEERTGHKLPEGFNPDVTIHMPTLDPIIVRLDPILC